MVKHVHLGYFMEDLIEDVETQGFLKKQHAGCCEVVLFRNVVNVLFGAFILEPRTSARAGVVAVFSSTSLTRPYWGGEGS